MAMPWECFWGFVLLWLIMKRHYFLQWPLTQVSLAAWAGSVSKLSEMSMLNTELLATWHNATDSKLVLKASEETHLETLHVEHISWQPCMTVLLNDNTANWTLNFAFGQDGHKFNSLRIYNLLSY
jgi:hypothetical protein